MLQPSRAMYSISYISLLQLAAEYGGCSQLILTFPLMDMILYYYHFHSIRLATQVNYYKMPPQCDLWDVIVCGPYQCTLQGGGGGVDQHNVNYPYSVTDQGTRSQSPH